MLVEHVAPVGQLGSPVVVALRARSRRNDVGLARAFPTGPAQAARGQQSPPSTASPLRRDIVPPARDARGLTLTLRGRSSRDLDLLPACSTTVKPRASRFCFAAGESIPVTQNRSGR